MDFGQIEEINWRQPTCSYKNLEIKSLVDHHKRREFLIGVEFSGQIEEINWHQRTYFNHIDILKRHLDVPNLISIFNHTRLIKVEKSKSRPYKIIRHRFQSHLFFHSFSPVCIPHPTHPSHEFPFNFLNMDKMILVLTQMPN